VPSRSPLSAIGENRVDISFAPHPLSCPSTVYAELLPMNLISFPRDLGPFARISFRTWRIFITRPYPSVKIPGRIPRLPSVT
jgi:hypothetical protein